MIRISERRAINLIDSRRLELERILFGIGIAEVPPSWDTAASRLFSNACSGGVKREETADVTGDTGATGAEIGTGVANGAEIETGVAGTLTVGDRCGWGTGGSERLGAFGRGADKR